MATTTPPRESQSTQWYFGTRESSGVTVSSLGNRTFITLPNGFSIVATGGMVSFTEPPARDRSPQFRGYRDFRDGNTWSRNRRRRGRGGGQARNSSHSSGIRYMGGSSSGGGSSYRPGPRGPIHANGHGSGNQIEQRARAELERQARNNRLQGRQQCSQGGAQGINVRSGGRNSDAVVVGNGLGDGVSAAGTGTGTGTGTGSATRTANAGVAHSLDPASASALAFLPSTNVLVSGTRQPTTSTSLAPSMQPQVQAHLYPPTTIPITNPFTQLMLNQRAPWNPSPPSTEEDEITVLGSRPVSHRRQRQNQNQHQQESQNYTANQQEYVHSHHSGEDGKVEDEDEGLKIRLDDLIDEAGLLDADEEALIVGLGAGFMDLTDEL